MTSPRPKNRRLAVVVALCVVGLILVPMARTQALASPNLRPPPRSSAVDLRLDQTTATRVLADLEGAAQANDAEKPRSMDAPAVTKRSAHPPVAAPPPQDKFAFLKDWPFWVIVGGVVLAGVGGFVLWNNSNQKPACDMTTFALGCRGSR
jgi:hypothetical protein